jgi:hypothetical protein
MSAHYPLPIAEKEDIDKLIAVYKTNYEVEISFDEAKQLLEQMMHFVYLTQIDPIVNEVVGHYNDPVIAQEVMKELRRQGQWGQTMDEQNTAPRTPPA